MSIKKIVSMKKSSAGTDSDVILWNRTKRELVYRFEEHDHGIRSIAFSHDERLLATLGVERDNKLIVWDLATGKIVASMRNASLNVITFGGMIRDIKRRDTRNYQLAGAGEKGVVILSLDPYEGELKVEPVQMGTLVRKIVSLEFSPDCEFLYAGSSSGDVSVIMVKRNGVITSFQACRVGARTISTSECRVYIGGGDGTVTVWSKREDYYGKISFLKTHSVQVEGSVTSIDLRQDESEILVGTAAGFVYRIRLSHDKSNEARVELVCENHCDEVTDVAFSHENSDRFVTCSRDCTIRVWEAADYSVSVKVGVRGAGTPSSVCVSTDHVFSGWSDGKVRCHAAYDGKSLWEIHDAHKIVRGQAVSTLCLSNNEKFVLSGGEDGAVRMWEIRSKEMVTHLKEHKSRVTQLALFSDDVHAISCSLDRSFLCWDLMAEKRISTHTQRTGGLNSIALSCDQSVVMTCGKEQSVTFWDLREHEPVRTVQHQGEATCIAVMKSNTNLFATGGEDNVVRIWDMRNCQTVATARGHSGSITSCSFSPDDKQLVSVGQDGNVFVWNVFSE
eukprot:g1212.t1